MTRDEIIKEQLREFERQLARRPTGTRFERLLIGGNIIDATSATAKQAGSVAKGAAKTKLVDRYLPSEFKPDPQFDVDVSLAPTTDDFYSPTLINPTAGTYQVRAAITQHHAGPLFQGCRLKWWLPTGWSWVDGNGTITIAETISNPIVITRLAHYSSGDDGWKVTVEEWYRA